MDLAEYPQDWRPFAEKVLTDLGLPHRRVLTITGPSKAHPNINRRLELLVCDDQDITN